MSDELKPCPFCGSPAQLIGNKESGYDAECTGQWCILAKFYERKADCIRAWNRRAGDE